MESPVAIHPFRHPCMVLAGIQSLMSANAGGLNGFDAARLGGGLLFFVCATKAVF
jgi:hypothetical protein